MKQAADNKTLELPMPGAKRGRGRPATGAAMTNAERQKAHRERQRAAGKTSRNDKVTENELVSTAQSATDVAIIKQLKATIDALNQFRQEDQAEEKLLIKERGEAWARIEQLKAELEKAKARIMTLQHQLDVTTLTLNEEKLSQEKIEAANKALRETVTKMTTAEKRKQTAAVKQKDLADTNKKLLDRVEHLERELKRHAKL